MKKELNPKPIIEILSTALEGLDIAGGERRKHAGILINATKGQGIELPEWILVKTKNIDGNNKYRHTLHNSLDNEIYHFEQDLTEEAKPTIVELKRAHDRDWFVYDKTILSNYRQIYDQAKEAGKRQSSPIPQKIKLKFKKFLTGK